MNYELIANELKFNEKLIDSELGLYYELTMSELRIN
jgi:hypothetical protein